MLHLLIRSRPPAARSIPTALVLAATVPLVYGSAAVAADMAAKTAASPPPYQWTGCYAGANGGGGAGSSNFNTTVGPGSYLGAADAATVSQDASGSHNNSNVLGGGQVGCNWQSGTVVFGLEGDYDYFRSTSSFYNNTDFIVGGTVPFTAGQSLTSDYLATVRPRIGIAADRSLAYVTGGGAFADAKYTVSYSDGAGGLGGATASKQLTGWVAGAGWEYAFAAHWTLRFEYLFAVFPKIAATGVITGPGATSNPLSNSANLVLQVARAGLNFKF